ncbi:hypothetical protein BO82DRAFT_45027 [Aspergillus uvarum CBS 121591]|uniref:Uncharacterized protein n=1 Tax=Aspergillus uvarum CBS 121591 TaxID=1448315 RepID=A0A319CGC5_9EURO|nr:hypothetical protein BO82DRAFT_45027 [Aspergillus uvarum CBS 121591]PYH83379.1 hypothetical protein BO82DRAFT_45027 [Aspergillus uvarum CBS 121591]
MGQESSTYMMASKIRTCVYTCPSTTIDNDRREANVSDPIRFPINKPFLFKLS